MSIFLSAHPVYLARPLHPGAWDRGRAFLLLLVRFVQRKTNVPVMPPADVVDTLTHADGPGDDLDHGFVAWLRRVRSAEGAPWAYSMTYR